MNTRPALFDHRLFSIYSDLNTPPHRKFYLQKFNFLSFQYVCFFLSFHHIGRRSSAAFNRFPHHIYLLLSGHLFYANAYFLFFVLYVCAMAISLTKFHSSRFLRFVSQLSIETNRGVICTIDLSSYLLNSTQTSLY